MKLWILRPVDVEAHTQDPWNPWYDKSFGFIVRARDEASARQIAASDCGDEGKDAWLNDLLSTCEVLEVKGAAGILMKDFASA